MRTFAEARSKSSETHTRAREDRSASTPSSGRLSYRIDLSGQPAGLYILTAEADGRRSQFKVVKE